DPDHPECRLAVAQCQIASRKTDEQIAELPEFAQVEWCPPARRSNDQERARLGGGAGGSHSGGPRRSSAGPRSVCGRAAVVLPAGSSRVLAVPKSFTCGIPDAAEVTAAWRSSPKRPCEYSAARFVRNSGANVDAWS